ncbi:MAG TPA: polysaccharide biosynthesis C-terminal domain-containing protein [Balneolaceae bacterium]
MKKLKELLSDTLIYGISSVLARFINYLLVPIHTKFFNTAQYGVVSLVYAAIAFLNIVFTFGMESAYLRYAKDRERARTVFKTIQLALLAFASLAALLLWFLAPLLMPLMSLDPSTKGIFLMMIGIIWFDTLSLVPFAELRLVRKSLLYAIVRFGHVLINVGLNLYLILHLELGIEAVFIANLVASGIITLIMWMFTARMLGGSWSKPILKKALIFGLPFIPAGVGYVINEMIDRFFLGNYMSQSTVTELYGADLTPESIVGIYSACYKLSVFMLLLVQMFRMAWQPFFLREADQPGAKKLYRDVFRYFNGIAGIFFLGVALFVEQIVQIRIPFLDAYLVDKEFWLGLQIVPLLLIAYWFQGWYMNFSAGIFIKEKTKVLPVITLIGAAVTISANLLLIPYFGMMGAATATLISYSLMAILLYFKSVQVYPVNYQLSRALLMVIFGAACVLVQPLLADWLNAEWMSRFLLLTVGSAGMILLSIPDSK